MSLGRRIEFGALIALAFFLPLYEAPKTLAWVVYGLAWIANRMRARDFGGRWDTWDTLIALWVLSGFVIAPFAGLHDSEWRGAIDVLRCGVVAWLVKRSDYSARERRWVFLTLVVSVVAGLALAHWRVLAGAQFLELNSVGHVNHTAIYVAIMLGACAAWLYGGGGLPAAAVVVLLLVSLVMSASRAGVAVSLVMLVVLGTASWRRSRRPLGVAALLVAATVAAVWFGGADVVRKQQKNTEDHNVLAYRDGIWRAALVTWQRFPVFGVGIDNYAQAKMDRVKAWREEAGRSFDARDYVQFPHAHSLYFNTLAERGVAGSLPLAALLAAWLVALLRAWPQRDAPAEEGLWWGSAAAAWIVTAGVGLVNTTLHHEHGILAALFLGLWLSWRRAAARATSNGRSSAPS